MQGQHRNFFWFSKLFGVEPQQSDDKVADGCVDSLDCAWVDSKYKIFLAILSELSGIRSSAILQYNIKI